MSQKTVLHVGCGPKDLRGLPAIFQDGSWSEIRLDIDPSVGPDVIGSITDMTVVATDSIDVVFSSHNIEHLYWHEVPKAFAEFRRVLKPSGFALITCPDLQSVAALVAEDRLAETAYVSGMGPIAPLDILYGHRASVAAGNLFMAHRGGFTLRTLLDALGSAGFARAFGRRRPQRFDIWALACKEHLSDEVLKKLGSDFVPV